MNEQGLKAAAKSGAIAVLDTLYQAHAEKLFRTVRRITRNREDAEDALQDAFLRATLHLQSFDGRSTFCTWMTRIAINSALMILRKKRSSPEVSAQKSDESDMFWEVADPAPNPEQQYAGQERVRLVRRAIAALRPSIRRALQMHALQDHSLEQTALRIGISVSAAKGRLFHAKAGLRKSRLLWNVRNRGDLTTRRWLGSKCLSCDKSDSVVIIS